MMYKFLSITVFENIPELNRGHYLVLTYEEDTLEESILDYKAAMKLLRQLEKEAGKVANLEINPYEKFIYTKEIHFRV